MRILANQPDRSDGYTVYLTLMSAFESAQRSIHITMAYFVPDPAFVDVLAAVSYTHLNRCAAQHFSRPAAPALCATMAASTHSSDREMPQRLRPGTRATLQVRQLLPGEFAWIITLLDPDTGNVRSTNYSERRYALSLIHI